ncbi:hypothetical protein GCM10020256_00260 [Streptomyces thermocoprophilus]
MKIRVLGPLTADVNGMSIVPTAGKPRQILALLALYPGRVMPVPTLMEEIWGTDLPQSALTTLQTYILQLRRRLGTAMGPSAPRHREGRARHPARWLPAADTGRSRRRPRVREPRRRGPAGVREG